MQLLPEPGRAGVASILAILLSVPLAGAGQSSRLEKVSFPEEVLPLLQQKCHHCHGECR